MIRPIRKAVFPVAGLGTRFLPATKAIPKEMIPVVDRPVIDITVAEGAGLDIGLDESIIDPQSTDDETGSIPVVFAVWAVAGLWLRTSANPNPPSATMRPPDTRATAAPGTSLSAMNDRTISLWSDVKSISPLAIIRGR